MAFVKKLQDKTHGNKEVMDFHGATIIDDNGKERAITEEMVQQACNKLEEDWFFPMKNSARTTPV